MRKVVLSTLAAAALAFDALPDSNIAYRRAVYQSSAADFTHVGHLVTDGVKSPEPLQLTETRVELPAELTARNLVLVAEDAEGRAEARLEVTPCAFVVQVVRECRQLRVKGKDGKPLVGAYVKVYAKDAAGLEVQFHKDGYTDLRGAFDYASISTDSSFKPAEYAVLVLPDGAGASIQRIPAGQ